MRDATLKVNVLPTQIEQLTPSHSRLDGKDDKGFKQCRSSAIAGRQESFFFALLKSTGAAPRDWRTSNQLHWVAGKPQSPLAGRNFERVGDGIQLAHNCGWGDTLEALVAIGRYVCACQLSERPVAYGATQYRVDPRRLENPGRRRLDHAQDTVGAVTHAQGGALVAAGRRRRPISRCEPTDRGGRSTTARAVRRR